METTGGAWNDLGNPGLGSSVNPTTPEGTNRNTGSWSSTHWANLAHVGHALYCHGLCHMAPLHQHDDGMFHRVRVCQVWLSRAVHPWQQGPDTGVFPWTGLHSLVALVRLWNSIQCPLIQKSYFNYGPYTGILGSGQTEPWVSPRSTT